MELKGIKKYFNDDDTNGVMLLKMIIPIELIL